MVPWRQILLFPLFKKVEQKFSLSTFPLFKKVEQKFSLSTFNKSRAKI
jgi:hypothetical protein